VLLDASHHPAPVLHLQVSSEIYSAELTPAKKILIEKFIGSCHV
jgi:hypothetical protein